MTLKKVRLNGPLVESVRDSHRPNHCTAREAEPGRELTWATLQGKRDVVRWSYRLAPANGGTDVTESFEVVWFPFRAWLAEDVLMRDRDRRREAAMRTTLERIKSVVEGEGR